MSHCREAMDSHNQIAKYWGRFGVTLFRRGSLSLQAVVFAFGVIGRACTKFESVDITADNAWKRKLVAPKTTPPST